MSPKWKTLAASTLARSVDGSFALGGSVCAVLVVSGVDPVLAIFAAMLAGMIAGAVTGFLHTVFEIPAILAGILGQERPTHTM